MPIYRELLAFPPCPEFAPSKAVEETIKESRPVSIVPGLADFPSEGGRRFEKPRITVQADANWRAQENALDGHGQPKDALDSELMHRLHGDMRRAVEEMQVTQAAILAAVSDLQTTLIRWIVITGIAVVVLLKLL